MANHALISWQTAAVFPNLQRGPQLGRATYDCQVVAKRLAPSRRRFKPAATTIQNRRRVVGAADVNSGHRLRARSDRLRCSCWLYWCVAAAANPASRPNPLRPVAAAGEEGCPSRAWRCSSLQINAGDGSDFDGGLEFVVGQHR